MKIKAKAINIYMLDTLSEQVEKIRDIIKKYNKEPHGVLETYSQYDALLDIAEITGMKLE